MWSAGSEPLQLYLGAWCAGWQRGAEAVQWVDAAPDWPDTLARLDAALPRQAAERGQHWRIWLGGALARAVTLVPPDGLSGHDEWSTWIDSAAATAADLDGACTAWVSPERGPGGALQVVVVQRALLAAIDELVRTRRARLRSVRPWWNLAVTQACAPGVVVVDDLESLVLWSLGDGPAVATSIVPAPERSSRDGFVRRALAEAGAEELAVHRVELPVGADGCPGFTRPLWEPSR